MRRWLRSTRRRTGNVTCAVALRGPLNFGQMRMRSAVHWERRLAAFVGAVALQGPQSRVLLIRTSRELRTQDARQRF